MFVVSYFDLPDEIVFTYDEMATKLAELGCLAAYEYKMEDRWVVKKKYFYIEELTWIDAGDWNIKPQYYSYGDPNNCSECGKSKFMQGNNCMSCNSCKTCNQIELHCSC